MEQSMSEQQVVLITGASKGLGAATAVWLARAKTRLVLNGRNQADLERVAAEVKAHGGEAVNVVGDVSELSICQRMVDEAISHWGQIDAVINNAAVIEPIGVFSAVDLGEWKRAVEINLLAPLYLARLAAEHLRQRTGRIINVSTGAAVHPLAAWNAYCATKAGLLHLTRTMAVEDKSIISISLRPGVIDTAMQDTIRRDGAQHMPAELSQYFQQLKDTQRLEPAEVPAKALAWLALKAPLEWSGELLEYSDPRLVEAGNQLFGANV
jgi:NAD(P)-dependent dehydrogenase (short-subunit alcohol dehydrogenase family)